MRRGIEVMAKSTAAKNGHERIVTHRDNSRHLEYLIMVSGATVTNVVRLQTKSVGSRGLTVLYDKHQYSGNTQAILRRSPCLTN